VKLNTHSHAEAFVRDPFRADLSRDPSGDMELIDCALEHWATIRAIQASSNDASELLRRFAAKYLAKSGGPLGASEELSP
jgi:hypothetical protein